MPKIKNMPKIQNFRTQKWHHRDLIQLKPDGIWASNSQVTTVELHHSAATVTLAAT